MKHTSFITAAACLVVLTLSVAPAAAQTRGHVSGGAVGRAAPVVGRAVPRGVAGGHVVAAPYRVYRPYSYPYRYPYGYYGYGYGYPYGFASYLSFGFGYGGYAGFGVGFGYPGYGGYYGYPGYAYGYGYPAYGGYGYPGYYGASQGYAAAGAGQAYGSVRIESHNRDAQVFADGYYVGIVDDFDGTYQHLNLEAGAHKIEIRTPNAPPIAFDVNVLPGRTITYRADPR